MKKIKVLVACEESQRVCMAFREKGHEAYSCDIIDCSGGHPEWHIKQDVIPLLNGNCRFFDELGGAHEVNGKWDLIIAHPPCTYLSNAGACRLHRTFNGIKYVNWQRYQDGLNAKDFFMRFLNADCDRIAVENPIPSSIFNLPKYTQVIQPYEHGEPWSKKTCLWIKGLPQIVPSKIVTDYKPYVSCGTSANKGNPDKAGASRAGGASIVRSRTFKGIAKAFAEQWGDIL